MQVELEPPFFIVRSGVSEDDFYSLAGEDSDWEYLDGRLVMSPASDRHEDLFRFLLTVLSGFLDERGGGVVRGSRYPMRLDEKWSPEPDLMVVLDERIHRMTPQRLEGPADLVIEIASESDPKLDVRDKLPRYQEAGIPEIWLIDPFAQRLQAYSETDAGYESRVMAVGRVESTVVEGFWIEVAWLWQRKLPSSLGCLRQLLD